MTCLLLKNKACCLAVLDVKWHLLSNERLKKQPYIGLNPLRPKRQYNGFANHEQYYNNNSRMLWAMKLK